MVGMVDPSVVVALVVEETEEMAMRAMDIAVEMVVWEVLRS
jgi:hypothetical protein